MQGLVGHCLRTFSVLTCSGYHRLDGSHNKHLFLTILEAGKSTIKVPADPVSGKDPLWLVKGQLLLAVCSHGLSSAPFCLLVLMRPLTPS